MASTLHFLHFSLSSLNVFPRRPFLSNVDDFGLPLIYCQLGHSDPQHTIFKMRLNVIQICICWQSELPPEFSIDPLSSVPFLSLGLFLCFSLPTDSQLSVLFDLDLHIIFLQPRNVQSYNVCRGGFFPISSSQSERFNAFRDVQWGLLKDSEGVIRRDSEGSIMSQRVVVYGIRALAEWVARNNAAKQKRREVGILGLNAIGFCEDGKPENFCLVWKKMRGKRRWWKNLGLILILVTEDFFVFCRRRKEEGVLI
ncbi:hypothetical protein L6164_032411 [Bauhinia variegata]|uniref:Uncharacterized protein n=1 Tax=Bauhinia variegata TaxID=167791 RepID=A0ACB9KNS1_BAUVA|nr:hypothetical protein L6164_032411 [Bauhinia variegata]